MGFSVAPASDPAELEKLRATLRTSSGIFKLHKQFWHIQSGELARRICPIFPKSEHPEIKKLCESVVKSCAVCRKHARPSFRPKRGGLWSHGVNDIIASDVFHVCGVAIVHIVCLFSGWSLFHMVRGREPNNTDLQAATAFWFSIFGVCRVFFSDRGGEYTSQAFSEFLTSHNVFPLFSPPQSPFTNGTCERHNGIGKVWILRLREGCPNAPLGMVVSKAQHVKNLTTRRHGFSAQMLAFGIPERPLTSLHDDLAVPGPPVDQVVRIRHQLAQEARAAVADLNVQQRLRGALNLRLQSIDTSPFSAGELVSELNTCVAVIPAESCT